MNLNWFKGKARNASFEEVAEVETPATPTDTITLAQLKAVQDVAGMSTTEAERLLEEGFTALVAPLKAWCDGYTTVKYYTLCRRLYETFCFEVLLKDGTTRLEYLTTSTKKCDVADTTELNVYNLLINPALEYILHLKKKNLPEVIAVKEAKRRLKEIATSIGEGTLSVIMETNQH
jgi:hypothetical protein